MKKKLSLMLALIFMLSLAFGVHSVAGAVPANNPDAAPGQKGTVELSVTYGDDSLPVKNQTVRLVDVRGGKHSATTDWRSGVATFRDVPVGAVTFEMITYTKSDITYGGQPESLTVENRKTVSGSINLTKIYDHVDVRLPATLVIDRQTNGEHDDGYPQNLNVTVTNVTGSYTIGAGTTQLSFAYSESDEEWRDTGLTMIWPDSISIACTLSDSENTYPFSHTYTGQEIADANDECPNHTGFDIIVHAEDIVNTITHKVTFKTATGGTINGGTSDIVYSGILVGSTFPEPDKEPSSGYEFDGWYDSLDNKTPLPSTVTADSTWTAKWTNNTTSFTIEKVDNNGDLITSSTAEFTLYNDEDLTDDFGTYQTDSGGTATVGGLTSGTYYLKETQAPSGYAGDSTVWTVIVGSEDAKTVNQPLSIVVNVDDGDNLLEDGVLTVTNTPVEKYTVTYQVTGDAPDNYTPDIPDDSSYAESETVSVAPGLTTTENSKDGMPGSWVFNGWSTDDVTVSGGTYTMPAESVAFTGSWTFTPNTASFTIEKVNENGAPITSPAAVFTLYKDDGLTDVFGTYSTDSGGTVTVGALTPGTYYLKETQAPSGYTGDSTRWTVVVTDENTQKNATSELEPQPALSIAVYVDGEANLLEDGVLTVTNTKLPTPPPPPPPPIVIGNGTLTVDKTASSADTTASVGNEPFSFTVTFTVSQGTVTNITNSLGITGVNGVYSFTLSADAAPVVFSNIPTGTQFTVTETISAAQAEAGWTQGTVTGASGAMTTAGATAVFDNILTAVAGASDNGSVSNDGQTSGEDIVADTILPKTGGVSPSTLIGLLGLSFMAISGTVLIILKRKNHGKSN